MVERDSKGRLKKGSVINPKGISGRVTILDLQNALNSHGKKISEDFWAMVARKAYTDSTILVAVLKKILPDKIKGELEGGGDIYNIIQQIHRDFPSHSPASLELAGRDGLDKGRARPQHTGKEVPQQTILEGTDDTVE